MIAALHSMMEHESTSLLPSHTKDWLPLMEDILTSPAVAAMERDLTHELVKHNECQTLSIDATLRCCLPILGQPRPRSMDATQAAFDETSMLRRVSWRI